MQTRIKQLAGGFLAATLVFVGVAVFSPTGAGPLSEQPVAAACSQSKFRIDWRVGVRQYGEENKDYINSPIIDYKEAGEIVWGPAGQNLPGRTKIEYSEGPHYITGYIPDNSRTYIGCI